MIIKEIDRKEAWEGFLSTCREKTFLQSWSWGERGSRRGEKVWRLGVFKGQELLGVAQVIKVEAKRGTFLLVPHGPASADSASVATSAKEAATAGKPVSKSEILKILLERLRELGRKEGASFIRISPIWERTEENNEIFGKLGFRDAPLQVHPEASWKLNLTPPLDELLRSMRKTTRYLIRQASQDTNIEIHRSEDFKDVKLFHELHEKVASRQQFIPFSLEYLENEFSAFQKDHQVLLLFGLYQGQIAAACFIIFWSQIGFYHHAASLPEHQKHALPYVLQWEAIKEAKKRGCLVYDFWGHVNPKDQPNHPWAGPTLFKMGFGGQAHEYVRTQDLPLTWKYWPTALFEKVRKIRRHL